MHSTKASQRCFVLLLLIVCSKVMKHLVPEHIVVVRDVEVETEQSDAENIIEYLVHN